MNYPISGTEVTEVIIKLLGGKAPVVDDIHPQFREAVDVVGLSWLAFLQQQRVDIWDSVFGLADRSRGPTFYKGGREVLFQLQEDHTSHAHTVLKNVVSFPPDASWYFGINGKQKLVHF